MCGEKLLDESNDILLHKKYEITKEIRPTQALLAADIEEMFFKYPKGTFLAEGGTGIGKSFAYLIPALIHGKRVVISTAKKGLQHQLVEKDLPYLISKMGLNVRFGIYKGTANYACCKLSPSIKHSKDRKKFIAWTADKMLNKKPADVADWPGPKLAWWNDISAENCTLKKKCEHYAYCRPSAKDKQILVVNHSLLAIDLLLGETPFIIFGPYDAVIVDEAHQAPGMFRDQLTKYADAASISRIEKALSTTSGMNYVIDALCGTGATVEATDLLKRAHKSFAAAKAVFNETIPSSAHKNAATTLTYLSPTAMRELDNVYEDIVAAYGTINIASTKLGTLFERVGTNAVDHFDGITEHGELMHLSNVLNRNKRTCERIMYVSKMFRNADKDPELKEALLLTQTKENIGIQPIDLGSKLGPRFQSVPYSVLLSATLKLDNGFDYIRNMFGFPSPGEETPDRRIREETYESPFDLDKQARIYMPKRLDNGELFPVPAYTSPEREKWVEAQTREIERLTIGSKGDALVLFTSKKDMDDVLDELNTQEMLHNGVNILRHEGDAGYVLDQYKKTPHSVLFGLKSFWEGVDLPGNQLRLVIISKLPFPHRDDPLIKALSAKSKNAFYDVFIPKMLFDLKQAVGRLIRTTTDHGVVAILDSRIWSGQSDTVKHKGAIEFIDKATTPKDRMPRGYGGRIIRALGYHKRAKTFTEAITFVNKGINSNPNEE